MNRIYRTIWNQKAGNFVAVAELAKSGGKKASAVKGSVVEAGAGAGNMLKAAAAALLLALGSPLYALPTDGVVVAGDATISTAADSMTINQNSQNVSLNWLSFDIGAAESVQFVQPDSSSVALNRVLGADPSSILGSLTANGQVFLINPNGILFGQGASVNVGGLVASTLDISDGDFMAGEYNFAGTSDTSVINEGSISAAGGYVALLGANVFNQGVIAARLGTVALAAGEAITLDVAGDGLLNVGIDRGAVNALVANGGMIQADGGQVLLSAQAAGNLLHTAVNNTGVIQAQTIENRDGVIRLLGDMQSGTVNVGGTLDASAPNGGDGGFIDTSAATVTVADDTRATTAAAEGLTGSWLIDPTDYTIAATGGDITGAVLSANLANTDIIIQSASGEAGTAGDVNVNDTVSWSANRLTLHAQNNINVNTAMHASGTASLALEYGQGAAAEGNTSVVNVGAAINLPAGENFSTRQGADGALINYTVITSLGEAGSVTTTDLQGMNGNLAGNYVLGANIDAAATSDWNSGAGFAPVVGSELVTMGDFTYTALLPFTGIFDGLGHTINGLTINQPAMSNAGMFGLTDSTTMIRNVGLIGGSVSGARYTGALVARNNGSIENSYATGSVTSTEVNSIYTGGLVGSNFGSISDSYATGTVNGQRAVGGLVGTNGRQGGSEIGTITRSYATGAVTAGTYHSGGLVGSNGDAGSIIESYATGAVSGGKNGSGGLAGQNYGSISTSYATGAVTNLESFVGGLVGVNGWTGTIALSYSSGAVSGGGSNIGGLSGYNFHATAVTNSYWNTDTSGQATSAGGTGLSSVEMQTGSYFAGFNFTTTPGATGNNWVMVNVDGTLNNAGGALGATRPMLASEYSTTINNAHQLQLMAMDLAGSYTIGQDIKAATTGTATDVWSSGTFIPVGNNATPFSGSLNGQSGIISDLTINLPSADNVGLIGVAIGSTISNVALAGASVTGQNNVGALVGSTVVGSLGNSNATGGQVTGNNTVGGLVGANNTTNLNNSYSSNTVNGNNNVGGLIGWTNGGMTSSYNYATGNVTGTGNYVGGLVGYNYFAHIINNSYATGNVSGAGIVGGLVGYNYSNGSISNSYATGTVTGNIQVGGLVGGNDGSVTTTYATGEVTGGSELGGLAGSNNGTVDASFWNSTVNDGLAGIGAGVLSGATGMTTEQMQIQANFTSATAANGNVNPGWDFTNSWVQYDTHTNPLLRSFMTELTITANDASETYDGQAYSGGNGVTYSATPDGNLLGSATYDGSAQGAVNAGAYAISASGFYSTSQQGYAITYVDGTLTVDPASLTLSTSDVSRTYDGTTAAAGTATITSGTLFGTDAISGGSFTFTDKNAGAGDKTVTTSGVTVTDGNGGGNYSISYADNTSSTIDRAVLTASATATDKIYDGTTAATATLSIVSGLVGGETVGATGGATFNSKDVSTANLVTVNSINLADGTGLASNYTLAAGQTAAAEITAKALTVSGMSATDKTYDGNTVASLSGGDLNGLVDGETLSITGHSGAFADKNVGAGKAVTVSGLVLADGSGLAGNYSVSNPTGLSADITRLDSVSWVGGASGNWFDPANWAGGAVPDLANVASVLIPAGVIVSFDDGNFVSPAQAGAVELDRLNSEGGLSVVEGSLNIADSLQLASLQQSGGAISSGGDIQVGSFDQSGGSLDATGLFTVSSAYSQSDVDGSVTAGGDIGITQASDSMTLGNISTAGSLTADAANGDIDQLAGTSIVVSGDSNLGAPNGTVTLASSGNSMGTAVVTGAGVTSLQNARVTATSSAVDDDELLPALNQGDSRRTAGNSATDIMAGLDIAVISNGLKLPSGMRLRDTEDDAI